MVGHLMRIRWFAVAAALLLMLSLCACVTYVPREEGTLGGASQENTESESTPDTEDVTESDTEGATQTETDSKGFPNLPEDGQTKRY